MKKPNTIGSNKTKGGLTPVASVGSKKMSNGGAGKPCSTGGKTGVGIPKKGR